MKAPNETLGQGALTLRYNFRSLIAIEDMTGIAFMEMIDRLSGSFSVGQLHALITIGLHHVEPDIAPDRVDGLVDGIGLDGALRAVLVALNEYISKVASLDHAPKNGGMIDTAPLAANAG